MWIFCWSYSQNLERDRRYVSARWRTAYDVMQLAMSGQIGETKATDRLD
jgi:hypothetical protein